MTLLECYELLHCHSNGPLLANHMPIFSIHAKRMAYVVNRNSIFY